MTHIGTATTAPANSIMEAYFHESCDLWSTAVRMWVGYISELPSACTPTTFLNLNARFLAGCLNLPGLATNEMLDDAGLKFPLLHDG